MNDIPNPTAQSAQTALEKALDEFTTHAHLALEFGYHVNTSEVLASVDACIAAGVAMERERLAQLLENMAEPWGGDVVWMTTGLHVANLAASVVRSES